VSGWLRQLAAYHDVHTCGGSERVEYVEQREGAVLQEVDLVRQRLEAASAHAHDRHLSLGVSLGALGRITAPVKPHLTPRSPVRSALKSSRTRLLSTFAPVITSQQGRQSPEADHEEWRTAGARRREGTS
jgi:hypothetical protein